MSTLCKILRGSLLILLTFASVGLFAQGAPEYMYYKFNAPGAQPNYALTPVGTNPAPLLGYTTGGTGQFGTALMGNGGSTSTNYLNTGWAPNFGTTQWTISMWLNGLVSDLNLYYLFGDPTANSFRCFYNGAAGAGNVLLRGGGLPDVLVTGVCPGPTVLTFVYNGSAVRYFKNGVYSGQVITSAANINGSGPFKVAAYSTGLVGINVGGLMDEFRMYHRALSDAEVGLTWNQMLPLGNGTITGFVTNSVTGLPISGATVSVLPAGPTTTTAPNGSYTLAGVSAGPHSVQCSATSYISQTKNIDVIMNQVVNLNFALDPQTADISGVVTDATNGALLIGAKIWVTPTPTFFTYSIQGGTYLLRIFPTGTYTLHAKKWGFAQWDGTPTLYTINNVYTQNIALNEDLNSPAFMTAALNPPQTAVNLSWGLPLGYYLRVYDDGTEENFTIWAAEGNMSAVKFSPLATPYRVHGCQVNIGNSLDYNGNAFVPFQVAVYDASGPGGKPGTMIGGPFDATPVNYGWNEFVFPSDVVITSGDFYIVQIQFGAYPDAAGIAIDTTTQQARSYQRFVTGGGPWLLASGNFMIRAIMMGGGGPILMPNKPVVLSGGGPVEGAIYAHTPGYVNTAEGFGPDFPASIINYQYWRLHQGEEGLGPAGWTSLGVTTGLTGVDNSWPSLGDGPYRWAVETQYTGALWSPPTFSNVIGKNWVTTATVNVTLSCDSAHIDNTTVTLTNVPFDSVYTTTLMGPANTGTASFSNVWKGNYLLEVFKFGYSLYQQNVSIMSPSTFDVFLLQTKVAPYGMAVNEQSLLANWFPPNPEQTLFNENFNGGFTPNQWEVEGSNWVIGSSFGNPAPSAEFLYYPEQFNYTLSITSKTLTGIHSPRLLLKWDVYLDNYGTTALNYMSVEFWNGSTWVELETYDNSSGGNIPWTTGTGDISSMTNSDFKVRFNAHGDDSYYIDAWYIDNVKVIAADVEGKNPCILGYNVLLDGATVAVVPDTFYYIPPALCVYGTTHEACAQAIYGSGYSSSTCATFTSHFLCPPTNLVAQPIEDVVYLTWTKPGCLGGTMVDICFDDGTEETGWGINPGYVAWLGNYFPIDPALSGDLKSFDLYFFLNAGGTYNVTLDIFDGSGTTLLGSSDPFVVPTDTWINVEVPDVSITGPFYAAVKYDNLPAVTNWFGEDTDGPNAYMDLAMIYDAVTWLPLSSYGYPAGVFLECAHLLAYGGKKELVITPGPISKHPPSVQPVPASLAMISTPSTPAPHITPASPSANDGQLGYNVYREHNFVAYVDGPNTLEYYDLGVNPGNYCYTVTAYYDLTVYGFPGQYAESLESNEACVLVSYGYELPFIEPWDLGSFDYQEWTFDPNQGNWSMNTAIGTPPPAADFSWQPMITGYDEALVSPTINAAGWTCADIWLDFDVKLVDRNATSAEFLDVEVFYNNNWFNKLELTNNGSFDWTTQHIDISGVAGKAFKIRFRANGANSADILHWYIDNIHAYGICHPATDLLGSQAQFTTSLQWVAPVCETGGGGTIMQFIFDDGTWENGWRINPGFQASMGNYFPIAPTLVGVLQSFDMYFVDNGSGSPQNLSIQVYDGAQVLVGESDQFSAAPFDEWITVAVPDFPFNGPFYAMVYWNNVGGNSYYLGDDEDGPYSGDNLYWMYDGASWTHPSGTPAVFLLRATALVGADLKMVELTPTSMRPVGGVNANASILSAANTSGDSKDHSVMGPVGGSNLDSTTIVGYNVWRADNSMTGPYNMIGSTTDLAYTDVHPSTTEPNQDFYYFIETPMVRSYDNVAICQPHSDTIVVHFPAVGLDNLGNNNIQVYPNPANDLVKIISTTDIKTIDVLNYIGQVVYTNKNVSAKKMQINVSAMQSGVYFVKVTSTDGLKTVKITVTH